MAGAGLALVLVSQAACRRPSVPGAPSGGTDLSGYLEPPAIEKATRDSRGVITLVGQAPAGAEVRLQQPDGGAFSATAGDDGTWSIALPASAAARMFSLEGEEAGRVIHGEGALVTLPAPGPPAVLARAGYGTLILGQAPGPLRIGAIDYDGAGGGAISGVTERRAPVRFVLDDQPVGAGEADAAGRFTILDVSARKPLTPGVHTFRVETQTQGRTGAVEGRWPVTVAAAPGEAVFDAVRMNGAYRLDWRIPGGGMQTTVIFDAPSKAVSS
jgi:hypothetical protein